MPAKWQQWYPHAIDAWNGSAFVQCLSDAGYRAYHNLLMEQYQQDDGMLPDDDRQLSLLSRSGIHWLQKRKNLPTIREEVMVAFESGGPGRIFNHRQYDEWITAQKKYRKNKSDGPTEDIRKARSEAGKKGNELRWGDRKTKEADRKISDSSQNPIANKLHTLTRTLTETKTETGTRGTPPSDSLELVAAGPEPAPEQPHDFDADPADTIPDGLSPVQYAIFVLAEASVPASYSLKVKTGDAIEILAKDEGCGLPEATRRMLDRMRKASEGGPVKWVFWLEDGGWKAGQHTRAAAAEMAFLGEPAQ